MAKSPSKRVTARVALINGQPTTTSRNIADTFGKRHTDVLERIKKLDCSEDFRVRNFPQASYKVDQPNGGTAEYTEHQITRDGFAFLCMGFTGAKAAAWKERYIATFNKMAERLATKAAWQKVHGSAAAPAPTTAPTLPVPTLRGRRWMVSIDGTGVEQLTPLAADAAVVNPHNSDELAAFLHEMVPQHLLGEALATLTGRTLSLLNHKQRQIAKATQPAQLGTSNTSNTRSLP